MLHTVLLVLHIVMAVTLIALILIQQGRGATAGAAFGSGASATVFGARGSGSFLTRATAILALLFFSNSFFLAYLASRTLQPVSLMEQPPGIEQPLAAERERLVPETPAPSPAPTDLPDIPVGD